MPIEVQQTTDWKSLLPEYRRKRIEEVLSEAAANITALRDFQSRSSAEFLEAELGRVAQTVNSVRADEEFVVKAGSAIKEFCHRHQITFPDRALFGAVLAWREGQLLEIPIDLPGGKPGSITIVPGGNPLEFAIVSVRRDGVPDGTEISLTHELNEMILATS